MYKKPELSSKNSENQQLLEVSDSLKSWWIYPDGKLLWYPLGRKLRRPQSWSWSYVGRKNPCPYLESNPGHKTCNHSSHPQTDGNNIKNCIFFQMPLSKKYFHPRNIQGVRFKKQSHIESEFRCCNSNYTSPAQSTKADQASLQQSRKTANTTLAQIIKPLYAHNQCTLHILFILLHRDTHQANIYFRSKWLIVHSQNGKTQAAAGQGQTLQW
jgi:hypothetical protein